jgi:hypothetical protein
MKIDLPKHPGKHPFSPDPISTCLIAFIKVLKTTPGLILLT